MSVRLPARDVALRQCIRPVAVGVTNDERGIHPRIFVSCGTRREDLCPHCADRYRGDWSHILRSGVLPGSSGSGLTLPELRKYAFYFVTMTAPSFGSTHLVPKLGRPRRPCKCGALHDPVTDVALRGVPIDPTTYRYAAQVTWNHDSAALWNVTRTRLRKEIEGLEYAIVREWQARGAIHYHALLRIPRASDPGRDQILGWVQASSTEATQRVLGGDKRIQWGTQIDIQGIATNHEKDVKLLAYLGKAVTYAAKSFGAFLRREKHNTSKHDDLLAELEHEAEVMVCPSCPGGKPKRCTSRAHSQMGHRGAVVSVSRGWSFPKLTKGKLRAQRIKYAAKNAKVKGLALEGTNRANALLANSLIIEEAWHKGEDIDLSKLQDPYPSEDLPTPTPIDIDMYAVLYDELCPPSPTEPTYAPWYEPREYIEGTWWRWESDMVPRMDKWRTPQPVSGWVRSIYEPGPDADPEQWRWVPHPPARTLSRWVLVGHNAGPHEIVSSYSRDPKVPPPAPTIPGTWWHWEPGQYNNDEARWQLGDYVTVTSTPNSGVPGPGPVSSGAAPSDQARSGAPGPPMQS